jgi:hypothetical protein
MRSGVEERFISQQLGIVKRDSSASRNNGEERLISQHGDGEERFICQQEGC